MNRPPRRPKRERIACLQRLRPNAIRVYRAAHRKVWPELEAVYREAGYTDLGCYLRGDRLVVWLEFDPRRLRRKRKWLMRHPVERCWQSLMARLKDPAFKTVTMEEVYRFPARHSSP